MIIDTHAHLMFENYEGEVLKVIDRAKKVGVKKIINVACGIESSEQSLIMSQKYKELYATIGLHPYDAADWSEKLKLKWLYKAKHFDKLVAVGEIGLDYFKAEVSKDIQLKSFRAQMKMANELNLPVIIHNREADCDVLMVLKEFPDVKAVFHCYGSDLKFALELLSLGYFISFTGIVTFKNAEKLRKVVKEIPMDKFFVETDCPYLAPQSVRGMRNEPAFVLEVINKIAEIKRCSVENVIEASTQNAVKFFSLN